MKKTITLLTLLFSFNFVIGQQSAPPPPGINYYFTIDNDNDGFATFDINYCINTYIYNKALAMGFNLSGYNLSLFPSFTDYTNNTNVIGNTYINQVNSFQYCNLKLVYSGTGTSYDQPTLDSYFSNIILSTVNHDFDDDNDGTLTKEEIKFSYLDGLITKTSWYPFNGAAVDDPSTPYDDTKGIPSCSGDYFTTTRIRKHIDASCH